MTAAPRRSSEQRAALRRKRLDRNRRVNAEVAIEQAEDARILADGLLWQPDPGRPVTLTGEDAERLRRAVHALALTADRQRIALTRDRVAEGESLLRRAAAGRREYAQSAPADVAAHLRAEAAAFDSAAQVLATGDVRDLIPSWRWTVAEVVGDEGR